jgi:ABC-type bacteriocin/lantibiotic exporter with double-glycine peptidase domain
MTVGELITFNMIASQVVQPILRLSQLWQDFQQVQVSVSRLGDILKAPPELTPLNLVTLPPPRGAIEFRNVTMRYRPDATDALCNVSLSIAAREVIGIVGPSGSGKSTLTKLIQRLYSPRDGHRRVELQEKIPRLNRFAGLDMDPRDFARIERFDHLGVTGRVDLTWRGCVNVQQTKK